MVDYKKVLLMVGKEIISNEDVKKFICGTYSDNTTRSFCDAIKGEFKSPKTKAKEKKKKDKKKKKNKKHDK